MSQFYDCNEKYIRYDGYWYRQYIKQMIDDKFIEFTNQKNKNIKTFYNLCEELLPKKKNLNKYYLSNKVIITDGKTYSLLLDDSSKKVFHIEKKFSKLLQNGITDNEIMLSEFDEDIKSLINQGILVKGDPYKYINKVEDLRLYSADYPVVLFELNNWCNQYCKHCYFYKSIFWLTVFIFLVTLRRMV